MIIIYVINLIIIVYSLFLLLRTRVFLKRIPKKDKINKNLLLNKKLIIAIPVLREQKCIEKTIEHFCNITSDIKIVIITTEKEIYEYKNKKIITTQDIVKNKILPKYKNVYCINYPKETGYMADQLNYLIDNLHNLNILEQNYSNKDIYLAIYNADSKPSKNTFNEIIEKINEGNLVIQQYSYCFKNYEKLNSLLKGFALYQSSFEIKTGLINTYLKSKFLYTHVVGHGLVINLKLLNDLNNFNTKFWCEDIYLSMQLKFKNIKIAPLLTLENIETPETLSSLIKQNSVWFNTTWRYKRIYKDIKKQESFKSNGLIGCLNEFRCAINWLLFSILIIFNVIFTLIHQEYSYLLLSIVVYIIYIFINVLITIKVINRLENKNYKITFYKIYCLFIATLISNIGPIYSLLKKSKTKYKTER